MDRLILLRHGKAESSAIGGDDFDRRLAERGRTESADTGRRLAEQGFSPAVILVSAAARTRETYEALADQFPEAQVVVEDDLYHAEAEVILQVAQAAGEGRGTVMVVGHNPGLHELAVQFLGRADLGDHMAYLPILRDFPTASAVVFRLNEGGRPTFEGLIIPGRLV